MKKDKHILINIDNDIYSIIERIAKDEDRTVSSVARRLLTKQLEKEVIRIADGGCSGFKKLEYK